MGSAAGRVMGGWLSSGKRQRRATDDDTLPPASKRALGRSRSPFVIRRYGSQFMDEDGDIAHEFFAEQPVSQPHGACFRHAPSRTAMAKVTANLKPVGKIRYDIPRLNPDLPYIMIEVKSIKNK